MVDFPDSPAPMRLLAGRRVRQGVGGRTEKQHLDLIALVLLVLEKLILNSGITGVSLLLFCRGTATHLD